MIERKDLIERFAAYSPHVDPLPLELAWDFAEKAHASQARSSGDPYITHCAAVADSLVEWRMDLPSVCAGLLHDTIEDTSTTEAQLRAEFGEEIAMLVMGVTKLDALKFESRDDAQAENWRKMLLATAKDIRVIVVKLADRLHNMKTLNFLKREKQERIAAETMALYSPLAHRLGMFKLKSELEDLSFAYIHPEEYAEIKEKVGARIAESEKKLALARAEIEKVLSTANIPCRILSRTKTLWSIYKKMERQKKPFEEIQDALGVRLITDTVANCYALLGIVHTHFKPVAGSFTDYISTPKLNLYRSLHTTIVSTAGELVEIQIRTEEMHRSSEYGIAAHWRYKTGEQAKDVHLEEKMNWLRQWMEWLQDLNSPREFLDSLKTDLEFHQVFIFTPAGEVKVLPEGATPLDFAYAVHTEVGEACVGAVVNNKMVKLDHTLKSGDICRILTKKGSLPKKDWLTLARTARARSKIRHWLRERGLVD
jgi:GTP pyrophosphokinase